MSFDTSTEPVIVSGAASQDTGALGRGGWLLQLRRHAHLLVLTIPVALVCVPFWPGHMNADTLNEISEVMSGKLTDYHSPILLAIWHLLWQAGFGPGWVLGATASCFTLGGYLLMRSAFGGLGAAVAAGALALVPQDYGQLGLVGRDTWYIALLLLSIGALAWAFRPGGRSTRRRRVLGILVALVAGWLAIATRQNAVTSIVVVFGAVVALVLLPRWRTPATRRRGTLARLGIIVAAAVVMTGVAYASQSVVEDALGVHRVHPEQYIYDYDLTGLSVWENRDLFPHSILAPTEMPALKRWFSVDDVVPEVVAGPLPHTMLGASQVALEKSAEIGAVEHAPLTWFHLHWDEFLHQIGIGRSAYVVIHPGIDNNSLGLHLRFPTLDRVAKGYVEAFDGNNVPEPEGGVVFLPWIYLLIGVAGLGALCRWRDLRWLLIGVLGLSSLTYQLGVFLSMGVGYRLEYPSVVAGVAIVILTVGALSRTRRGVTLRPRRAVAGQN